MIATADIAADAVTNAKLDSDLVKTLCFQYDFADLGGAVGAITLTDRAGGRYPHQAHCCRVCPGYHRRGRPDGRKIQPLDRLLRGQLIMAAQPVHSGTRCGLRPGGLILQGHTPHVNGHAARDTSRGLSGRGWPGQSALRGPADPLLTLRMLNDAIGLTLDRIQKAKTPEEPKPAPKLTIVRF